MTDRQLAQAVFDTMALERSARETFQVAAAKEDLAEKDAALVVLRHVTAARKSLESWIGTRAMRAQLT